MRCFESTKSADAIDLRLRKFVGKDNASELRQELVSQGTTRGRNGHGLIEALQVRQNRIGAVLPN
jgi:hypothetical protein